MATVKSFTDLQQSKKLAEILPIASADMQYISFRHKDDTIEWIPRLGTPSKYDIPCWSLASLLNILPDYTLQTNTDGTVFVVCDSKKPMISDAYDNPVDACVEMVEKLNELKIL